MNTFKKLEVGIIGFAKMYLQLFDKIELFDREFSVLVVNFFIL